MADTYVTPPPLEEAFKAVGTPSPKNNKKKYLVGGLVAAVFLTIIGAVLYSSGAIESINNDIRQRAAGTSCGCEGGNYVCHYSWGGSDSWPRDSCKQQSQPTAAPTQQQNGGSGGGTSGGGNRGLADGSSSGCCSSNGQCTSWYGSGSTCSNSNGACSSGKQCKGGSNTTNGSCHQCLPTDCHVAGCGGQSCDAGCQTRCGNNVCENGETKTNCPADCAAVTPTLKPGYECNPGVGLPYNGDIRCGSAGGCADATMGQVCGVDGKWVSGCVRAHACGYVTTGDECTATKTCQSLGYGSSYTCGANGRCVDSSHNYRYFIGCSNSNPCLNCYSDGVCVMENSSCSIKPECRGGTTAPTTTVTQVAQVTNQPTSPAHTQAPTTTVTTTTTPTATATVTVTATATPTPNSCNGTCTGDSNCQSGLVCSGGYCRNSACTSESSCVCATTTATTAPTPNSCNGACTGDSNCQSGLVCSGGYCRNSACTSESSCTCPQIAQTTPTSTPAPVASTPAPTNLPDAGFNIPTVAAFGGGLLMVILGMLFAL